jgi:hypothetical protein
MIKGKKAQLAHGLTWIYKFMILVAVVGGIVFIVLSHYSKPFDVREMEASILSQKVDDCIAPNGIFREFGNASLRDCIPFDENEIYLNVSLGNDTLEIGDPFLATLCQAMQQKVSVKKPPVCRNSCYLVLDKGELKKLDVFIAIKKIEKNVK